MDFFFRRYKILSILFLVCLAPTLCIYAEEKSSEDKLVLISPHWEGIRTEFSLAFTASYKKETGRTVTLDWRDMGGASDDLRFILSEFKHTPDSIGIDLFFGGGLDPYMELKQKNLLKTHRLPPAIVKGIPKDVMGMPIYDPEGQWFGAALSTFGILKNQKVVDQMKLPNVKTWSDLTDPVLKGWIGSGDPRNSGSVHLIYENILQANGWDKGWRIILGLGKNVRQFDRGSSTTVKSCSLGNVAYALAIDFYAFMQIAEADPGQMSLIIPAKESILTPDGIAMLKGAPHAAVAEKFLDFVLSEEGQSLWLAPKGHPQGAQKFSISRMSIRPDLYKKFAAVTPVKTNPFQDLHPIRYDPKKGGARWNSLNALIGACIIDRPPSEKTLSQISISEDEFMELTATTWKDPLKRNQLQQQWQTLK